MSEEMVKKARQAFQSMHEKALQDIKYKHHSAIEWAMRKTGRTWDDNRQRLSFYDYFDEYLEANK